MVAVCPRRRGPLPPALFMVVPRPRAGVKAPTTSVHAPDYSLGSPPLTPTRGRGAGVSRAGGSDRLVELTSPLTSLPMTNDKQSFHERVAQMHDAAEQIKAIAEIVAEEAIRMAAAQKRFAERNGAKTERRAR